MTDVERLYRASEFCHSMSYLAVVRGKPGTYEIWRKHAKAYASAARLISRRNHRSRMDAMARMVDGAVSATDGDFAQGDQR